MFAHLLPFFLTDAHQRASASLVSCQISSVRHACQTWGPLGSLNHLTGLKRYASRFGAQPFCSNLAR
ncbi:hypothetical protein WJX72_010764 [[Myrmecia] bisecta]|uniref:Secreted protein n=1 Tax=[Myrmecia] bisecta TaxID=41462 RepID=A0AAW1PTX5_9CHLO